MVRAIAKARGAPGSNGVSTEPTQQRDPTNSEPETALAKNEDVQNMSQSETYRRRGRPPKIIPNAAKIQSSTFKAVAPEVERNKLSEDDLRYEYWLNYRRRYAFVRRFAHRKDAKNIAIRQEKELSALFDDLNGDTQARGAETRKHDGTPEDLRSAFIKRYKYRKTNTPSERFAYEEALSELYDQLYGKIEKPSCIKEHNRPQNKYTSRSGVGNHMREPSTSHHAQDLETEQKRITRRRSARMQERTKPTRRLIPVKRASQATSSSRNNQTSIRRKVGRPKKIVEVDIESEDSDSDDDSRGYIHSRETRNGSKNIQNRSYVKPTENTGTSQSLRPPAPKAVSRPLKRNRSPSTERTDEMLDELEQSIAGSGGSVDAKRRRSGRIKRVTKANTKSSSGDTSVQSRHSRTSRPLSQSLPSSELPPVLSSSTVKRPPGRPRGKRQTYVMQDIKGPTQDHAPKQDDTTQVPGDNIQSVISEATPAQAAEQSQKAAAVTYTNSTLSDPRPRGSAHCYNETQNMGAHWHGFRANSFVNVNPANIHRLKLDDSNDGFQGNPLAAPLPNEGPMQIIWPELKAEAPHFGSLFEGASSENTSMPCIPVATQTTFEPTVQLVGEAAQIQNFAGEPQWTWVNYSPPTLPPRSQATNHIAENMAAEMLLSLADNPSR